MPVPEDRRDRNPPPAPPPPRGGGGEARDKGGRPPSPDGPRSKRIHVVYTKEELATIDAAAAALRLTRTVFIRQSTLLRADRVLDDKYKP